MEYNIRHGNKHIINLSEFSQRAKTGILDHKGKTTRLEAGDLVCRTSEPSGAGVTAS